MSKLRLKIISFLSKFLTLTLLSCISIYIYSSFKTSELPKESELEEQLQYDPVQVQTSKDPFTFSYVGSEYLVEPKASYDIAGLVVSHNNITSFGDIYHDEKSVDIKDLCLIWGENLNESMYKKAKFWSESVSCNYQFDEYDPENKFYGTALSNNHLISSDPVIREKIKNVRVGDQIKMKGYLVNYSNTLTPDLVRKSSLTRKDTAGGACEVMYVSDIEILKQYPRLWHNIYDKSKSLILPLLIVKILSFIVFAWVEFR